MYNVPPLDKAGVGDSDEAMALLARGSATRATRVRMVCKTPRDLLSVITIGWLRFGRIYCQ